MLAPPEGRPAPARATRRVAGRVVLACVAVPALAALGIGLAALGAHTSPVVMLVPALVPPAAALVLSRPVLAPALVFLAIPVAEADLPGPIPLQLIDLAVIVAVVLVALGRVARGEAPLRWVPTAWWAAALLATAGLSLSSAVDPGAAGKQVLVLGAGVLLALAIVATVDHVEDLRLLGGAAVAVGAAVCLAALPTAGALRTELEGAVVENRATSVFADPNELGCFAALTLLLALGYAVATRGPATRCLAAVGVLAAAAALVLSLSRGAWFGALLGLVAFAVLVPASRRRLAGASLLGLVLVPALVVVAPDDEPAELVSERLGTIEDPLGNPYDERPLVWRAAVDLIGEHPLLGVGPAGFPRAFAESEASTLPTLPVHAHNLPLTLAVELGLPATALLLGLAVSLGVGVARTVGRERRRRDEASAALVAGAGAALAVFVGQGVVDYTLRNATIMLLAWALVGFLLAAARLPDEATPPPPAARAAA
jgi:putative inorganic carbon (hco3(-)) transporter